MFEKVVWVPDTHVPYHDRPAVKAVIAMIRWFKPDIVIHLGDLIDFYQVSKYPKDPQRIHQLQSDLDGAHVVLAHLRDAAPNARFVLLQGNHEARLPLYLWREAKGLASLDTLTVPAQLDLKSLHVEYVPDGWMMHRGVLVKHGNVVRSRGGYSAAGELDRNLVDGVSGHTHRLGHTHRAGFGRNLQWMECGCVCVLNMEYMQGQTADWRHGIGFGYFAKSGSGHELHTAPIDDGVIVVQGTRIQG